MVGGVGSGIDRNELREYDVQKGTVDAYAKQGLDGTDGFLNRDELMVMFEDLGADSGLSATEIEDLADYVLSQSDMDGKVSYDQVMEILDETDGDNDGEIEFTDLQVARDEIDRQDNILVSDTLIDAKEADGDGVDDDIFVLSSEDNSSTFEFTFIQDGQDENGNTAEDYEDGLASIIDFNGSLSKTGLEELLGGDPARYKEKMQEDPMVKAVIAMGLMAVGLDEAEVTFIMNELTTDTPNPAFTVDDLLNIAANNTHADVEPDSTEAQREEALLSDEAENIRGIFAAE